MPTLEINFDDKFSDEEEIFDIIGDLKLKDPDINNVIIEGGDRTIDLNLVKLIVELIIISAPLIIKLKNWLKKKIKKRATIDIPCKNNWVTINISMTDEEVNLRLKKNGCI